jgi:hypothetical protein
VADPRAKLRRPILATDSKAALADLDGRCCHSFGRSGEAFYDEIVHA